MSNVFWIFLGFNLFILLLPLITSLKQDIKEPFAKSLFQIFAIFSCCFFILEIPHIFTILIGIVPSFNDSSIHNRNFYNLTKGSLRSINNIKKIIKGKSNKNYKKSINHNLNNNRNYGNNYKKGNSNNFNSWEYVAKNKDK